MAHPTQRRNPNSSTEIRNLHGSIGERLDQSSGRTPDAQNRMRAQIERVDDSQFARGMANKNFPFDLTCQNEAMLAKFNSTSGSRNLTAAVRVTALDDQQGVSVIALAPDLGGTNVPASTPLGGVTIACCLTYGLEGVSTRQYFTAISGEVVRFPLAAEDVLLTAILTPRYFNADDSGGALVPRVYRVGTGGGSWALTNQVFNYPNQAMLTETLVSAAQLAAFNDKVTLYGSIAEASSFSTSGTTKVARRIFYGSVPFGGGAHPTSVICPVSYGSRMVRLVGPTAATNGVQIKQFHSPLQIDTGAGISGNLGPFPANTDLVIPAETNSIEVSYIAGATPAIESTFELHYYMSM